MQVYRGLDAGTAKPPPELRARLPHHLIDICGPEEQFNAGDFVRLAKAAMEDTGKRGKRPIIAGGTGFYINNLVSGLPEAPPGNAALRSRLKKELETGGAEPLLRELAGCDPVSAEKIHKNDVFRLLRALEVFRLTGRPLSSFRMNTGIRSRRGQVDGGQTGGEQSADGQAPGAGDFLVVCLERGREDLYRRINLRTAKMFKEGLAEEVRSLFERGFTPACPALRAIGYREFFIQNDDGAWRLAEDISNPAVLQKAEETVAQNSRRYAKRQMTYSKNFMGAVRIFLEEGQERSGIEKLAEIIRESYGL